MKAINLQPLNDPGAQQAFAAAARHIAEIPGSIGIIIEKTRGADGPPVITGWHYASQEEILSLSMSLAVFEQNNQHEKHKK